MCARSIAETAKFAVDHLIEEVAAAFADIPRVAKHIDTVRADLIENVPMFAARGDGGEGEAGEPLQGAAFDRYEVNVLIAQNGAAGAPIVDELHPTLGNLIGRIDYVSAHGVLMTNFRLIKPGAIHRASGGYLLIDARALLIEPFSWSALKRALRRGEIVIEDVGRFLGLTSTVSLEPDAIPLRVKVVLFGDRLLYFLLSAWTRTSASSSRFSPISRTTWRAPWRTRRSSLGWWVRWRAATASGR